MTLALLALGPDLGSSSGLSDTRRGGGDASQISGKPGACVAERCSGLEKNKTANISELLLMLASYLALGAIYECFILKCFFPRYS